MLVGAGPITDRGNLVRRSFEVSLGIFAYLVLCSTSFSADYSVRPDHPRMLLNPDRIEEVRSKISAAPRIWQDAIKVVVSPKSKPSERIICAAAIYRVGLLPKFAHDRTREQYGEIARKEMLSWKGPLFGNQEQVESICPLALGYDWIYELLSDEERRQIRERIEAAIRKNDTKNPDIAWRAHNQWDGNGMIGALAIHGDTPVDYVKLYYYENWMADRPDVRNYRMAANWFPGGGNPEGFQYYSRVWSNFAMKGCWESATSPSDQTLANLGLFKNSTLYQLNSTMPLSSKRRSVYTGAPKYNYGGHGAVNDRLLSQLQIATGYGGESGQLSRWILDSTTNGFEKANRNVTQAMVSAILLGDPRVKGKSPSDLGIPLDFVQLRPGEYVGRSDWSDQCTMVSFACSWRLDRIRMNGDVMVVSKGKVLTGCRDRIFRHCYGEPWFRNNVLFYEGDKLAVVPIHNVRGVVAGSFKQVGETEFVGESAPRYGNAGGIVINSPRVKFVQRRFRYDRENSKVTVRDEVACDPTLTPRICWNTPLQPDVNGNEITLRNAPATATMRFDPPPKEIRVVGGPNDWDFTRDYAGELGNQSEYAEFAKAKLDGKISLGGFYTIFVAMPPGGGVMTTTITVP